MLKTCSHCGIVSENHVCKYRKPRYKDKDSQASKFRVTKAWAKKRDEIKTRDKYLCRVCMSNKYNTIDTYNYNKLEVHHIVPIEEDYNKRLDNDNLITLCAYHHHLSENGDIPREELLEIIKD